MLLPQPGGMSGFPSERWLASPERPRLVRGRGAQASVRRALDAAKAALAQDAAFAPTLPMMAEAAGVSPRTLQRHFAQVLKLSPQAAMQRLRLDAARQTLRSGEAATVLDAALRHGFDHPGRFASSYARAFGERPSGTLQAARALTPADPSEGGTRIVLRPLAAAEREDDVRARRATDDLAIALGRVRDLTLLHAETGIVPDPMRVLRLEGRVEANGVVLSLLQPARGRLLRTIRERLAPSADPAWAMRVAGAVSEAIAAEKVERARRTPRHRADVETLITRARPAALSQEPALVGMALDLLREALQRDPTQARAHALMAWSQALSANHVFTRDALGERARAAEHCRQALALALDDPEVLTLVAGAMSLTRHLDEAQDLVARSLALDPYQPEALRRLGFIQNFRGDGRRAAGAFRRALNAFQSDNDLTMSLIGLGVANFILRDYGRSARALARALDLQPSRAWPHRFLAAAAMHAGAHDEARRSLAALRRSFPDLTVTACAQSDALHPEARNRVLEGLARAGLPA